MKFFKNEKGFTLIEMLIVMLIIAILLLLIIPNIAKQSTNLRSKGCDALVKTVQTQVEAYRLEKGTTPSSLNELVEEKYINEEQTSCDGGTKIKYDSESGEVHI